MASTPSVAGSGRLFLYAAISLVVAGCGSSMDVKTYRDPGLRIPPSATYAWHPAQPARRLPEELDPRVDNPTIHGRVKQAVETVLAEKGFRQVEEAAANFLVSYRVGIREQHQWQQVTAGARMSVIPVEYTEGGLMITLVERTTGKLVFQSLGLSDVSQGGGSEKAIQDAVTEALKDLP